MSFTGSISAVFSLRIPPSVETRLAGLCLVFASCHVFSLALLGFWMGGLSPKECGGLCFFELLKFPQFFRSGESRPLFPTSCLRLQRSFFLWRCSGIRPFDRYAFPLLVSRVLHIFNPLLTSIARVRINAYYVRPYTRVGQVFFPSHHLTI